MKRFFTLILSLIFIGNISSQVGITPGSLSSTISEKEEHVYELKVTNNGTANAQVWWKINKSNLPLAWQVYMCDSRQCYTPSVDATPQTKPNEIEPGKTQTWTLHLNPNEVVGSGKIFIQLFSDKTLKTLLAETDKEATIVADRSLSTSNFATSDIKVYPNPTDDFFTIKNDANIAKVMVYNIIGKEVESFKHYVGAVYNVSDYIRGIYIIKLVDAKGKTVRSIRLNKR
jgi:hypothetical protein